MPPAIQVKYFNFLDKICVYFLIYKHRQSAFFNQNKFSNLITITVSFIGDWHIAYVLLYAPKQLVLDEE